MPDNTSKPLSEVFDHIYRTNAWGGGSGPGSDPVAAKAYLDFLMSFLLKHSPKVVVDVGCGDGRLAEAIRWDEWGAYYVGIDVSQQAVEQCDLDLNALIVLDGRMPDLCKHLRPNLALIKDVFQHLPFSECEAILGALTKCRHILVTNDIPEGDQPDCGAGGYRPIDITKPPLNRVAVKVWEGEIAGFRKATYLITNS